MFFHTFAHFFQNELFLEILSGTLSEGQTVCMLGVFSYFCSFFLNDLFLEILSGTLSVSNGLDPDQDGHSVGPDLGPNCLQRL